MSGNSVRGCTGTPPGQTASRGMALDVLRRRKIAKKAAGGWHAHCEGPF